MSDATHRGRRREAGSGARASALARRAARIRAGARVPCSRPCGSSRASSSSSQRGRRRRASRGSWRHAAVGRSRSWSSTTRAPTATAEAALALGDSRVEVVRHERNRGVGAAIATGYRQRSPLPATARDAFVVMAGDGQMDPHELPSLVESGRSAARPTTSRATAFGAPTARDDAGGAPPRRPRLLMGDVARHRRAHLRQPVRLHGASRADAASASTSTASGLATATRTTSCRSSRFEAFASPRPRCAPCTPTR